MKDTLIKKVQETIKLYKMLKDGDTVLVGVSGGPDSVCLLYVLKELQEEYSLSLHIAHLHHGIRGIEADEDVRFVQSLGDSLRIPVYIEYADIPSHAKIEHVSKQEAAREVRYKFFNTVADKICADRVALGHTADDQVETFLMRILKGSGPHGLAGIPPVRDRIIRPLIGVFRAEIKEYLSEHDIRYRIDSSNLSAVYLRNKIRLELIPYLAKEYNPNIMDTLIRNLNILRDENIFLDEYVGKIYRDSVISESADQVRFDIRKFDSYAGPVKRRLIRYAVGSITGEGCVPLSFKHVEDALSLLQADKRGEVHLPRGIIAERDGYLFSIYLKTTATSIPPYAYTVSVPGETIVPEAGMTINTTILPSPFSKDLFDSPPFPKGGMVGLSDKCETDRYTAYFDMSKFSEPLTVRNRRTGDFFCPAGMGGKKKKIKEYFIDLKIPRRERERIPILTSPEGIIWVAGYRSDERFRVTAATEKILEVRAVKIAA